MPRGTPTPETGGNYDITFTARNTVPTRRYSDLTLTVNEAPKITSGSSATFTAGSAGTFTVTASGNPAPALKESGTLPSGVTFGTSTAEVSGTPTAGTGGTYSITFTPDNTAGTDA